jgi:hypothetical protein
MPQRIFEPCGTGELAIGNAYAGGVARHWVIGAYVTEQASSLALKQNTSEFKFSAIKDDMEFIRSNTSVKFLLLLLCLIR